MGTRPRSNYCADIDLPPSSLPTPSTSRKPPTDRSSPDQNNYFLKNDVLKTLSDFTDSLCPPGYKLEVHEGKAAIYYKMDLSEQNSLEVTETIVIDSKLHAKLYKRSMPIPLPQWFTKGGDCCVKRKSILILACLMLMQFRCQLSLQVMQPRKL